MSMRYIRFLLANFICGFVIYSFVLSDRLFVTYNYFILLAYNVELTKKTRWRLKFLEHLSSCIFKIALFEL
jgi:hypothetical protein